MSAAPRWQMLVETLGLAPHPEGGYYREVYRSPAIVRPGDGRGDRTALTTIFFLLPAGSSSCWHRVASDEAWHFHEGDPLELFTADASWSTVTRHVLGGIRAGGAGGGDIAGAPPARPSAEPFPVHVVAAGCWQAARSTGAYTLVGCTVGPGFDFADFEMLRDTPLADDVRRRPDAAAFV